VTEQQQEFWSFCAGCGAVVTIADEHVDGHGEFFCTPKRKRDLEAVVDTPFSVLVVKQTMSGD
jgi:hypothetical protein